MLFAISCHFYILKNAKRHPWKSIAFRKSAGISRLLRGFLKNTTQFYKRVFYRSQNFHNTTQKEHRDKLRTLELRS